MRRRRIAAIVSGLGVTLAATACGALLGIDDVGYDRTGDGAGPPGDGALEGASGDGGGDAPLDAPDGAADSAGTGCAFMLDAFFCADFDEGDKVRSRLHGKPVDMMLNVWAPGTAILSDAGASPPSALRVAVPGLVSGASGRGQLTMKLTEQHSSFHLSAKIRYVVQDVESCSSGEVEFLRFYLSNPSDPQNCTIGYGTKRRSTGITAHCPNTDSGASVFNALILPAAPSDWMPFTADVTFGPPLKVNYNNGVSDIFQTYDYSPDAGQLEFFLGTVSLGPCGPVIVEYDDFVITTN